MNDFSIQLYQRHWIYEPEEEDLCAHGFIKVCIGNEIFDDNQNDGWTISAMALLLLRTLELDHTLENPVGDCLIPCCGYNFFLNDSGLVYMPNCPNGYNWQVKHLGREVELRTQDGVKVVLHFDFYKNEILKFVDEVSAFYESSKPKILPEDRDTREGYLSFWNEWKKRRLKWNRTH